MPNQMLFRHFFMRWRRIVRHGVNLIFRRLEKVTRHRVRPPHLRLGISGEEIAAEVLEEIGVEVLERNVRNRYGEIDIIARENGMLCFIEVKTRHRQRIGRPADAVNYARRRRYARAAAFYMSELTGDNVQVPHRFDIVEVIYDGKCPSEMNYLRGAFEEPWKKRRPFP